MSSDSVPHDGDRTSDLTRQRTPGQLARYTPSSWHTVPPVHEYVYSGEQNIHLSPLHRFMRIPESGICTARWRPTMAVPVSSTTVRYNRTPPLVLNLPEESTTCHGQATECAIATLKSAIRDRVCHSSAKSPWVFGSHRTPPLGSENQSQDLSDMSPSQPSLKVPLPTVGLRSHETIHISVTPQHVASG